MDLWRVFTSTTLGSSQWYILLSERSRTEKPSKRTETSETCPFVLWPEETLLSGVQCDLARAIAQIHSII